jgi:hypothetical protein
MPNIKFTKVSDAPLLIYDVSGKQGDVFDLQISVDLPEQDVSARNLFVEGEATYTRTAGQAGPHPVTRRVAGDATFDPQQYETLKAGTIRIEVATASFKYYCISHPQYHRITGLTLRPAAGHLFVVPVGKLLFLGKGSIMANNVVHAAPKLISVQSADTEFVAEEDCLLVQINGV